MTAQLREELDALADTHSFSPDPAAWDRGRRARRRGRVVAVAAVLVLVASVGGLAAAWTSREPVAPAGRVDGGAIPSQIEKPTGDTVTDLAFGPASVAYVDSDARPVLVSATTGEVRHVELPDFPGADAFEVFADFRTGSWLALSPDGTRLAYPTATPMEREPGQVFVQTPWYRTVDLVTGKSELLEPPPCGATPWSMTWTPDERIAIDVMGRASFELENPGVVSCAVHGSTGAPSAKPLPGVTAPDGTISATFAGTDLRSDDLDRGGPAVDAVVDAVPFVTSGGQELARELPTDTYPDGAVVRPVGWADDSLLVAEVGNDLVLLSSPDRPESEWTWQTLVTDVPEGLSLSAAVDLVPDLTGDPDQELTHDFTVASAADGGPGRVPVLAGGVLALLAGLAFVRMLRRRA